MKMTMGIRAKLVTTLIITCVIPLIIAISITYFVSIHQRKEIIGESFQQLSEKARESITVRLIANIHALRNLSVLPLTASFLDSASTMSRLSSKDMLNWEIANIEKQWPKLGQEDEQLKRILENPLADLFKAFNSVQDAFGEIFATDVTGQLAAAFHYLPISPLSFGLFLLGGLYAAISLILNIIQEPFNFRMIIEPIVVLVILWSIAFWIS